MRGYPRVNARGEIVWEAQGVNGRFPGLRAAFLIWVAQMTLDDYLAREGARRWDWGNCDCVQFGLGWAREATGRPLAPFFTYQTRVDAERALQARGGLENIVRDWMDCNSFEPTGEPEDGDIGLAPSPAGGVDKVAIVIRRGPWWITREPRGIGGMDFGKIPAWRVR